MALVLRTAQWSLSLQLLITAVTVGTFFVPMQTEKRDDIIVIVALETVSQVIEFVWYLIAICVVGKIQTGARYLDWVWSTPVMLVSTALFFLHRDGKPLGDALRRPTMYVTLAFNWVMLAFGYALETGRLSPFTGVALGGAAFVGSFTSLATFANGEDSVSLWLFGFMYAVWGAYGVAATWSDVYKNVAYNVLDIVSKNFYGAFLFVYSFL